MLQSKSMMIHVQLYFLSVLLLDGWMDGCFYFK